jgi:predicted dithiol-disulfide oxidoreductase (DUF899 family)
MAETIHAKGFPGETDPYREARDQLLAEEIELRRKIEAVAARRRASPLGGEMTKDYVFETFSPDGRKPHRVRFTELCAPRQRHAVPLQLHVSRACRQHDALSLVHRDHRCDRRRCALRRPAHQLGGRRQGADREVQGAWRAARLAPRAAPLVSGQHVQPRLSCGGGERSRQQWPLAHVFSRRGGRIHHTWSSELWFAESDAGQDRRHVDFMWPMWSIFDMTPEGRGTDWGPKLSY